MMRYAVIGSGGREHALAWKLANESETDAVFVVPGNAGIALDPSIDCRAIPDRELVEFCQQERIDLVVIGPEAPLCAGLADTLRAAGIACFGPSQRAAQIEGSKSFAKQVMDDAGVPTASYRTCDSLESAITYLDSIDHDVVIKADGLAAGKGVVLPESREETESVLREFIDEQKFGDASKTVVIEERLEGPEVSFMVITDGVEIVALPTSRDHKRLNDHDRGPNTGGMGAVTPASGVSDEDWKTMRETMKRVVATMAEHHGGFVGFLYGGFMLTASGPKVLEFNARLGDPETQALMVALGEQAIGPLLHAAATTGLAGSSNLTGEVAACVVLASQGYPAAPQIDRVVTLPREREATIFFAGVRRHRDELVSSGGRVLSVVAASDTLEGALGMSYATLKKIRLEGGHFRRDIGR